MLLNSAEINKKLSSLPDWQTNGQQLTHTYEFENFIKAIDFVNLLVEPAERAGHHPDIAISYNKVTISLSTHDEGGITSKDFDLATKISNIAKNI
jgi:4a-hydroxytetrahydrobiopterin dehydratase